MHNQTEFTLHSGHIVRLVELNQTRTNEGWLEGLPTKEWNARTLHGLVNRVAGEHPKHGRPFVVPPIEKPIPYDGARPYPFGTPSILPDVTCVARFASRSAARDGDWSELIVIWMQDAFAMPIAEPIIATLLEIDWSHLATDFDY